MGIIIKALKPEKTDHAVAGKTSTHLPYSTFNDFRRCICAATHGLWDKYVDDLYSGKASRDGAFAQLLDQSDTGGSLDCADAAKLLKDFEDNRSGIYNQLCDEHKFIYDRYEQILRECVALGGVVYWS